MPTTGVYQTTAEIPHLLGPHNVADLRPGRVLQCYTDFGAIERVLPRTIEQGDGWHPMVRYLVIQGPKRATIPPDHGGLEARLGKNPLYITVQEVTDGTLASDLRLPSGMCVAETRLEMYLADFGIVPYEDGTFETITRTALVLQEH